MDTRNEIRDFLTSRRARITPEQAALPAWGGSRRVAGLRREEVALLAGVSVDYYTRLEHGNARGVSDAVLDALARALHLDEAERAHLFDLVRSASVNTPARPSRRPARPGFLFPDPCGPEFYVAWERQAQDTVAMLRSEAGRYPHDRPLSGLIGELSTRSETFRT
jgi:transcriptional regulator with XRE-family HTH domain